MSGLIDMLTTEVSKVKEKEKGEAMFPPHGSTHMEAESGHYAQQLQKEKMSSIALGGAVGKFKHLNRPRLLFSEDSVLLLVTCVSP